MSSGANQRLPLSDGMKFKYALAFAISSYIIAGLISILAGNEYANNVDPVIEIASAYFQEGNRLYQQGDHSGALSMYQESINLHVSFPFAWSNFALMLEEQGHTERAFLAHTGALHLYPSRARNCYNMARLATKDQISLLQEAVRLSPLFMEAQYALAKQYIVTNNVSGALVTLQHILRHLPNHLNAHIDYCALLYAKQNPIASLSCFIDVLSLNESSERLFNNLALLYLRSSTASSSNASLDRARYYFQQASLVYNSSLAASYLSLLANADSLSLPITKHAINNYYMYFDPLTYTSNYASPRFLVDLLQPYVTPSTRFLDLGSGVGHSCNAIRQSISSESDITIVGVDFSSTMISLAMHKYPNCYSELMQRDIFEFILEYADYHFDIIYATDTLAHLPMDDFFARIVLLARQGTVVAFNVDRLAEGNISVLPTMRYGYSDAYVSKLSVKYGFDIVISQEYESSHVDGSKGSFVLYVLQMLGRSEEEEDEE